MNELPQIMPRSTSCVRILKFIEASGTHLGCVEFANETHSNAGAQPKKSLFSPLNCELNSQSETARCQLLTHAGCFPGPLKLRGRFKPRCARLEWGCGRSAHNRSRPHASFSEVTKMNPWHRLPPLRSLRVLEAAVRHENYTRAAAELNLTHSAVSHQIHALEDALGVRLLERAGRRMRATEHGSQLAQDVRATLDTLNAAVERVRGQESANALTVSVLPSFAAAWLVARLGGFLESHPQIELRLESSATVADFRNDGVDVAIRF